MTANATLETHYEVWHDKEGVKVDVGPDRDGLDMVEVRATDQKSKEYFGDIRLTLTPEIARLVGQALIKCADDMSKENQ